MELKHKETIADVVRKTKTEALALLEKLVNQNSFSHNKQGVDAVAKMVAQSMPSCFKHKIETRANLGDHHIFLHVLKDRLPILLAGHIDTLCPEDPKFNRLSEVGEKLYGPGVNDMKGGDTVLICSLKVLEMCGLLDSLSLLCIFNGDEELGSPSSRDIFTSMKNKAELALVFECGGPEGTVVTTRKGISRYRLIATGQAGHFGNLKKIKISALEELAHKAVAIENMNRPDKSLVANVGKIECGLAANAVAETGYMDFEIRYWDPEIGKTAIETVTGLAKTPVVQGCKLELQQLSYRPAMQPTEKAMDLFNLIVKTGAGLDQKIIEEKRGGVSDACFLSDAGIPTIDGLGPLGDGDFTREEHIVTETLFQRIELTANLIAHIGTKN